MIMIDYNEIWWDIMRIYQMISDVLSIWIVWNCRIIYFPDFPSGSRAIPYSLMFGSAAIWRPESPKSHTWANMGLLHLVVAVLAPLILGVQLPSLADDTTCSLSESQPLVKRLKNTLHLQGPDGNRCNMWLQEIIKQRIWIILNVFL